jgi:hypothetical protein
MSGSDEARPFKEKKPKLDTGIRLPNHATAKLPRPERTHRDAAAEAKQLLARDSQLLSDPVSEADRLLREDDEDEAEPKDA